MRFTTTELAEAHDTATRAADIIDSLNAHDYKGLFYLNESELADYADLETELEALGYSR